MAWDPIYLALKLVSECGDDLSTWPSSKGSAASKRNVGHCKS